MFQKVNYVRRNLFWIPLIILLIFSLLGVNMIGITVAQVDHDIAVVGVTPSPTTVRLGELVNVTVVVENKGTVAETFNTTAYYDTSTIETKTVQNLTVDTSTTLTFTWDTTDVKEEIYATDEKEKTYTINVTAPLASDEQPGDNTYVSPSKVKVVSHYIAVVPQSIVDVNMTPGKNFTVSIHTDYNGSDIWSYAFALTYDNNVLHGVSVANGDLITKAAHPDATYQPGEFNNTLGELGLTGAYFFSMVEPVPTTSGPGILANVTFTVVGTGDSDIILDLIPATAEREAKLHGWTEGGYGEKYTIIDYHTPVMGHILDGFFQNIEEVTHDIAVTSVTPFPTSVEKGEFVNITVTVKNNGTVNEDVTVKVWDGEPGYSTLIGTKTAPNLAAGATTSLTFAWDTTDVPQGNYTVTAVASIPGDTDTLQSEETVTIKLREEQPLPILTIMLIIGIVAVVVLVVIVYAVRRR